MDFGGGAVDEEGELSGDGRKFDGWGAVEAVGEKGEEGGEGGEIGGDGGEHAGARGRGLGVGKLGEGFGFFEESGVVCSSVLIGAAGGEKAGEEAGAQGV